METRLPNPQQILDDEHLRLLSIFYYVKGGITALFACIPIIHVVLGLVFIIAPHAFGHGNDQPPAFLGWLFVILGSFLILFGWTFAVLAVITGRCLSRRKHYAFCFIVACIECLSVPFGTVLGVFTILVLNRQSVKELFKPRA
jgi:Ca2+/Na+ antiporter